MQIIHIADSLPTLLPQDFILSIFRIAPLLGACFFFFGLKIPENSRLSNHRWGDGEQLKGVSFVASFRGFLLILLFDHLDVYKSFQSGFKKVS